MVRYTLWGTARGNEDWQEDILLSDATPEMIATVTPLALRDGFRNLRTTPNDDAPPVFGANLLTR